MEKNANPKIRNSKPLLKYGKTISFFLNSISLIVTYLKNINETGKLVLPDFIKHSKHASRVTESKFYKKVISLVKSTLEIQIRYFRDFTWADYEKTYKLLHQTWITGIFGKVSIITLFAGTAWAAFVIFQKNSTGSNTDIPGSVLFSGLAMFTIGWAFALISLENTSIFLYSLLCAYMAWYGIIIGAGLRGTIWSALPIIWMWLLAFRYIKSNKYLMQWVILFMVCFGAAYLTYNSFRFNKIIPLSYDFMGRLFLGILYFGLLYFLSIFHSFVIKHLNKFNKTGLVFGGSLFFIGLFFLLAQSKNPQEFTSNTMTSLKGLLGIVDIFWMWLGAGLFKSALELGTWNVSEATRLISSRHFRILVPAIWILVLFFGLLTTFANIPIQMLVLSKNLGLMDWANTWTNPVYFSVQTQVYITLIVSAIAVFARLINKITDNLLSSLNAIWIACFVAILGYYETFYRFSTVGSQTNLPGGWWLTFVLIGGLILQLGKAGWGYLSTASNNKIYGITAGLLFFLAIATITLGAGLPDLILENTLYTFQGIIYLGIPLALYQIIKKHKFYEPEHKIQLIGFIILGCLSAIPVLFLSPYAGIHFWLIPIFWWGILLLSNKFYGNLNNLMDGAFAGATMAFGFVTFWMSPEVIPIPFFSFFLKLQNRYLFADLNRPTIQAGQLWLTLSAVTIGILLGIAFSFRSKIWPIYLTVIGASLCFALFIPSLPGVPQSINLTSISTIIQPETIPIQIITNIPNDWKETLLKNTNYFINIPISWKDNSQKTEIAYPINLISADRGALFSLRLLDGEKYPAEAANDEIDVNKSVFTDFQVLSPPAVNSNELYKWIWSEGYSKSGNSYVINAYVNVPEGILEFIMLSADTGYVDQKLLFNKIINSLHRK